MAAETPWPWFSSLKAAMLAIDGVLICLSTRWMFGSVVRDCKGY